MTRLKHPNLIRVYNFRKDKTLNTYFIAMEYIDGQLLSDCTEKTSISTERAITLVAQLLRSLSFIHSRNIIHRDIKPENIMLINSKINGFWLN